MLGRTVTLLTVFFKYNHLIFLYTTYLLCTCCACSCLSIMLSIMQTNSTYKPNKLHM